MKSKKFGSAMQRTASSYLRRGGELAKKIGIVLLVSVLAMTLTASVAAADNDSNDAKVYSGAFCIGRANTSAVIDNWRGRLFNNDSIEHWVGCPFVRDVVGWGGTASAWVKVVDRHCSKDIACGLWSQNVAVGDGWSGYVVSVGSSGCGTGIQTLNFPVLSNYSNNSMYAMECIMPEKYAGNPSQITAYSLTEN
jgi:hypothetical protein